MLRCSPPGKPEIVNPGIGPTRADGEARGNSRIDADGAAPVRSVVVGAEARSDRDARAWLDLRLDPGPESEIGATFEELIEAIVGAAEGDVVVVDVELGRYVARVGIDIGVRARRRTARR
jgi:hypothetical protein